MGEVELEVGFAFRTMEDPETFKADEIAAHLISVRFFPLPPPVPASLGGRLPPPLPPPSLSFSD